MKPLLILSIIFFASCKQKNSDQTLSVQDSSAYVSLIKLTPKQFECGTSDLVVLTPPDDDSKLLTGNFKAISYTTTKKNFLSLLKLAEKESISVSSFDAKKIKAFYIPTSSDSIWLTFPSKEVCWINRNDENILPLYISYWVDSTKNFKVRLTTDSIIINLLTAIIKDHKLGNFPGSN